MGLFDFLKGSSLPPSIRNREFVARTKLEHAFEALSFALSVLDGKCKSVPEGRTRAASALSSLQAAKNGLIGALRIDFHLSAEVPVKFRPFVGEIAKGLSALLELFDRLIPQLEQVAKPNIAYTRPEEFTKQLTYVRSELMNVYAVLRDAIEKERKLKNQLSMVGNPSA